MNFLKEFQEVRLLANFPFQPLDYHSAAQISTSSSQKVVTLLFMLVQVEVFQHVITVDKHGGYS